MLSLDPPELITLSDYHGDWSSYLDVLYECYLRKIVQGRLFYDELPVRCQFRPEYDSKGFAFWHTISEGIEEDERIPDLRRCERINWIAWVINHAVKGTAHITSWENKRGSNIHTVLFFERESYVVILAKRKDYHLLKTAYCANPHRVKQLIRERDAFVRL